MTTSTTRNRKSALPSQLQATFGRIDAPKLGRRGLMTVGLTGLLIAGVASADWKVYDDKVYQQVKAIKDRIGDGNVNDNLKTLNDRFAIDKYQPSQDEAKLVEPKENDDKLPADKANPTAATNVSLTERCPGGANPLVTGIPAQQYAVCKEMYNTEIAQYRFSLEMYDLAKARNERLNAIVKERKNLEATDYGDLEANSNHLIALQTQMDNDRDRYQTYMQAYGVRMVYLQKSSDLLSKQAINGSSGGTFNPIPALLGAGALAIALRTAAKTDQSSCTQQMSAAGVC